VLTAAGTMHMISFGKGNPFELEPHKGSFGFWWLLAATT
jgi:hypothetical protein